MQRNKRGRWPWYLLTALVLLGPINWTQPAGANNSDDGSGHGAITQEFDAGSADGCGTVTGKFEWSPTYQSVLVRGAIIDQPAEGGTVSGCGERETIATFTAYTGTDRVALAERVDDTRREFLGPLNAPFAIDRIVIKVCHIPVGGGEVFQCGTAEVYGQP